MERYSSPLVSPPSCRVSSRVAVSLRATTPHRAAPSFDSSRCNHRASSSHSEKYSDSSRPEAGASGSRGVGQPGRSEAAPRAGGLARGRVVSAKGPQPGFGPEIFVVLVTRQRSTSTCRPGSGGADPLPVKETRPRAACPAPTRPEGPTPWAPAAAAPAPRRPQRGAAVSAGDRTRGRVLTCRTPADRRSVRGVIQPFLFSGVCV